MAGRVPLELVLVDKVSGPLKRANASADKFANTIKKTGGALKHGGKNASLFGKGAAAAGMGARAATPGIVGMGAAVQAALGPIALLGGALGTVTALFKGLSEQDFAETKVETLGVNSEALVTRLKDVSKELGNQQSVLELTTAAYDVASAGFTDAADTAKVLKASALAASGGFSDLNTVGDATTSVLNAYGLSASEANAVVDKFIQTQNDGKIIVAEYAQGIGKVASVAATLKVPLEEVNAVIAQATAAGVKSEVAFTGLKAALARLGGTRGAAKLEKLGINISAATLASEGLAANLKKLDGLTFTELESIFGQEAIQTMAPVLNNMEKYLELIEKQKTSAGAAAAAQKKTADTIQGAWKELTVVISNAFTAQSELGTALKTIIEITTAGLKLIGRILEPTIAKLNQILELINKIAQGVKDIVQKSPDWFKKMVGVMPTDVEPPLEKAGEDLKTIEENATGTANAIDTVNTNLEETKTGVEDINTETDVLNDKWAEVGLTIKQDVTNAIGDAIKGSKSLGQSMSNVLSKIADQAMNVAINMALWGSAGTGGTAGLLGGVFKGIFGSAQGGTIGRGNPRIVGERGPEVFVPHSSGKVIPNNRIGGGTNINVSVNATESNVSASGGEARQLGESIAVAIQQQLVKERRPGGLLYT